jgi:hypothetical protein
MFVPLVLTDLRVQVAHHRLRTLQGLDELVIGNQQRSGDAQFLVRRAGYAEDLAQLVLALGGPDAATAAIDQPENRSGVARRCFVIGQPSLLVRPVRDGATG